jgi:lysophospholipid acyltransferase (LPLAT)-like uncharacterized protein
VTPEKKARLIATTGAWIVRLVVATLRIRVHDEAGVLGGPSEPRLIWVFWHNRLFVIPRLLNRYLPHRPGSALTSASKDGAILAAFLQQFNIRPIRGSSSRRGAAALLEMKRLVAQGYDVAITPDGPRGPRYRLNAGPIALAQKTGALVMPIRVQYSRFWQLKSWDAFRIPIPFARVDITLLPLHTVLPTENEAAFEAERARLESILGGD